MYERKVDANVTTVMLEGDIDLYNADEFKSSLQGIDGDVILDCTALDYIDSTGLGVLVAAFDRQKQKVKIVGLKPHLFRIFELTGLTAVFDIEVGK